ncbi:MAG TPA: DUF929 family protein [Acidimicrobiales bacterium]|nr:DUF929 family protein [Acidimicrobiales bacterium]
MVLAVAAIATMVVVKAAGSTATPPSAASAHSGVAGSAGSGTSPLPSSVAAALGVQPATLDAVGAPDAISPPQRIVGGSVQRDAAGRAVVTYVGAEYCPYCAAERWALAVALARFGTFSNLSATHSSTSDVYPDTQSLSFYGSSYTSEYVDFQPVEEATNRIVDGGYGALQAPTAAQASMIAKADPQGSIPFIDIANAYVVIGASFSPQVLQGLSNTQIAAALSDAQSPVAKAVDGTANYLTAAISAVTGSQPSSVAESPVIAAIAKQLGT